MPEEETVEQARQDKREGLSPSTQAGEFVREEMEHIREGIPRARSPPASDCDRIIESATCGSKIATAEARQSEN